MGFLGNLGVNQNFFGSFDLESIGNFAVGGLFFFLILIIAGIIAFVYFIRKTDKSSYKNSIPIFQNINGKYHRIGVDRAKEVFVPDSNVSLYYLKAKKIYIARPTKAMGKDEFWYSISENGEWVNFDLANDPEKNTLANANYDHRDTRYAFTNLREIIKRNYKDKSVKWWKEYAHVITFIICAAIFVIAFVILFSRMGTMIDKLAPIAANFNSAAEKMAEAVKISQNLNSGVIKG